MTTSSLRIVGLYPELLGTYGDGGNLEVLAQRLRWRGLSCEVTRVGLHEPVPEDGDLYVMGGGEDMAQIAAVEALRSSSLVRTVERGAYVFGVCAGMQLLGHGFIGPDGRRHEGMGLLDMETERLPERAVGEVLVRAAGELVLPLITGFENHRGRTILLGGVRPVGQAVVGTGNGDPTMMGAEGAVQGRVMGTYLHGPVLARNPFLADLLLERILGEPLAPCVVTAQQTLYAQCLSRASS